MNSQKSQILILGVTASGKGRLAFELAKRIDAEIISIDSMKVYRRMDIGTAKPPIEARKQVPYHLIDIVEPSEQFNVGMFLELAEAAKEEILSKNKSIIAAGGTALYIKAMIFGLFKGPGADENIRAKLKVLEKEKGLNELYERLKKIDSAACEKIHSNDSKRILRALEVYELTGKPISSFQNQFDKKPTQNFKIIGLRRDKQAESRRINIRAQKMIADGLVDEVKSLLAEDKPLSKQARCAIGYAEIIRYLSGEMSLEKAIELIKVNSRRLAKHQRTWFRTFPSINWLDVDEETGSKQLLEQTLQILQTA
ncbi:MAG: tRNA (adenosine(37)-N6)-dimethylallyltransferase MiaA [Planctomycetota bacterium]|jgi:tRNA dimethylallyltransferase